MKRGKTEFCIMPESGLYFTKRLSGLERHEVFFGRNYRSKSIEDGLVVFLEPERHRGYNGVHGSGEQGIALNKRLKEIGQKTAMDYYGWSVEQFIERYGMNYIE